MPKSFLRRGISCSGMRICARSSSTTTPTFTVSPSSVGQIKPRTSKGFRFSIRCEAFPSPRRGAVRCTSSAQVVPSPWLGEPPLVGAGVPPGRPPPVRAPLFAPRFRRSAITAPPLGRAPLADPSAGTAPKQARCAVVGEHGRFGAGSLPQGITIGPFRERWLCLGLHRRSAGW